MSLYDRDYARENSHSQFSRMPQMRMSFPQLTPMVKILLIINVSVFFLQILGGDEFLRSWFSVYPFSFLSALQIWRLVTYQFLHDNIWHILFNMLGLFFLGPTLERHWGSKRFLRFYIGCGIAGALFYIFLAAVNFLPTARMIGASGAILGMLAACAILFPQFVVLIFFFPVPIRVAAVILIFIYVANLLTSGPNAGGDAAHLAGMAAGALYVLSESRRTKFGTKIKESQWDKKMADQRRLQAELDRILRKVHESGIHSLTRREKKTLQQATEAEQRRNA